MKTFFQIFLTVNMTELDSVVFIVKDSETDFHFTYNKLFGSSHIIHYSQEGSALKGIPIYTVSLTESKGTSGETL